MQYGYKCFVRRPKCPEPALMRVSIKKYRFRSITQILDAVLHGFPVGKSFNPYKSIAIYWIGSGLEEAPTPTGPWTRIADATSPYRVLPNVAAQFYRPFCPNCGNGPSTNAPANPDPEHLVWIPPGTFLMPMRSSFKSF